MAEGYETDTVTRLETNLDDISAEILGAVMTQLLALGALDVFFTPIQMKKQRPGIQLSVLCTSENVPAISDLIFRETSAFGLRMEQVVRLKLTRKFVRVTTEFGEIQVKLGLKGEEVLQVAPEFESCRLVAEATGQPLRAIFAAAEHAWREQAQAASSGNG